MDTRRKTLKMGILFILLVIAGGLLLLYTGNDAVAQGLKKKDGIVTAEQVQVSFDSVSGRLIKEAVQEAQEVKKGDILLQLDSTDVDLSIQKTLAQIAQLDAQIRAQNGSITIGLAQTDTNQEESYRGIDQQKAAVAAAEATLENSQRDYKRKRALFAQGAIAKAEMDDAQMALQVAEANATQQKQALSKLLGGAADAASTNTITLPAIEEQRQSVLNQQNDREALLQQKKQLEVTLQELYVQKERLTLRAPEDAKVLKLLAKQGEMVTANTPVILLESKRWYYDIYLSEKQAVKLHEGDTLHGHTLAGRQDISGTIRFITQAPGFADLKMTREKGSADLSAFQVRVYTAPGQEIMPGMTIEVNADELS